MDFFSVSSLKTITKSALWSPFSNYTCRVLLTAGVQITMGMFMCLILPGARRHKSLNSVPGKTYLKGKQVILIQHHCLTVRKYRWYWEGNPVCQLDMFLCWGFIWHHGYYSIEGTMEEEKRLHANNIWKNTFLCLSVSFFVCLTALCAVREQKSLTLVSARKRSDWTFPPSSLLCGMNYGHRGTFRARVQL